jgi:spore coat protein CotH
MYLLVEPPVSGLRRAHPDCVSVFRRSRPNGFDVEWTASVPGVRTSLKRLRALVDEPGAADTAAELAQALDETSYFRWLAVNALLRNADSLDELFLYERRGDGGSPAPLRVLAWDYDDIIDSELKPGALSDPLLYGSLDPLEHRVATDRELYTRYRRFLKVILANELSLGRVERVVLEMQALRDSLDDGSPAENQRRARKRRAAYVDEMLATIRESHRQLSELTASF